MLPETLRLSVLLSVGRHPHSGRKRMARQDARALEMGLALARENLLAIHAGDSSEPALQGYLGMGLSHLNVLELPPHADVVVSLVDYFETNPVDIMLTGVCAELGESSGMIPFLLAEKLGFALVTNIAAITSIDRGYADVLQALPRGQRRSLRVQLPFVASVDSAAPAARQSAFGIARRGCIRSLPGRIERDKQSETWLQQVAQKRPKRLKLVKAASAAERFKAATAKAQNQGGKVIRADVAQSAKAIFDLLREEGVLRDGSAPR